MPFIVVRNDLVSMHADAIVNTANPEPVIGGGTDRAVYEAAGPLRLLSARKKIGQIGRGEAAITPAFKLHARYIIHTVGPKWKGGKQGEEFLLRACYRNSLKLASEYGCKSIAFPLISTGVYGFPKSLALTIVNDEVRSFLDDSEEDMMVYLVVFDEESAALSAELYDDLAAYIDDHYAAQKAEKEYERRDRPGVWEGEASRRRPFFSRETYQEELSKEVSRREAYQEKLSKEAAYDAKIHKAETDKKESQEADAYGADAYGADPCGAGSYGAGSHGAGLHGADAYLADTYEADASEQASDEYRFDSALPLEDLWSGVDPELEEFLTQQSSYESSSYGDSSYGDSSYGNFSYGNISGHGLDGAAGPPDDTDYDEPAPSSASKAPSSAPKTSVPSAEAPAPGSAGPSSRKSAPSGPAPGSASPSSGKSASSGPAPGSAGPSSGKPASKAAPGGFGSPAPPQMPRPFISKKKRTLDEVLEQTDETFQQMLLRLIQEKGMTNAQAYKKANQDKKLFSKIKGNVDYQPKKTTAVAFAIALELNLDQTKDLLGRAGYALSNSNKFDIAIMFFIENQIYDIFKVEEGLFDHNLPLLCNY